MTTQPELLLPLAETLLDFRVKVPEGCELVVALRTPTGQLVELTDLVAEDAGGVAVGRYRESEAAAGALDGGEVATAAWAADRVLGHLCTAQVAEITELHLLH